MPCVQRTGARPDRSHAAKSETDCAHYVRAPDTVPPGRQTETELPRFERNPFGGCDFHWCSELAVISRGLHPDSVLCHPSLNARKTEKLSKTRILFLTTNGRE